jgi:hypothetical protein
MPRVGFEPKIAVFERVKSVQPLDRAAAVTVYVPVKNTEIYELSRCCRPE